MKLNSMFFMFPYQQFDAFKVVFNPLVVRLYEGQLLLFM